METSSFFLLTGAFGVSAASTAAIAIRAPSRWRFATPLTVGLSLAVAYLGLDATLGTAKPVGLVPGWSRPNLKTGSAMVLSATPIDKDVVLTLQESRGSEPRLYRLPATDDLMDALKRAQERHAKAHGGEKFGFSMVEGQDGPEGTQRGALGAGQGHGAPGQPGDGRTSQRSPYSFREPVEDRIPPKD